MTTDSELEEAAELYCPDRTVKMPNGEDLFIVHSKKQGFLAGARYAAEKSAERIKELEYEKEAMNSIGHERIVSIESQIQESQARVAVLEQKLADALNAVEEVIDSSDSTHSEAIGLREILK